MYDGIRATSNWAALYFILLMTIGYYVLLNLLVAILVEGFLTPLVCLQIISSPFNYYFYPFRNQCCPHFNAFCLKFSK